MTPDKIKKSSGEFELFNEDKLYRSLVIAGASEKQARRIVSQVKKKVPEGSSTRKIFSHAFRLLKKESKLLASHYSLSKSIHELGPDGFLFEKYICALFHSMGYEASTNHYLSGKCVKHEIDILAKKNNETIYCECKFHNHPSYKNDLKTALYVQARHEDIKSNPDNNLSEFWLISNTKFSTDAIDYSECAGLKILGPNYPHKEALGDLSKRFHVYPITCLTSLKKIYVKSLLKDGIILTKELIDSPKLLDKLNLPYEEKEKTLTEIKTLMRLK